MKVVRLLLIGSPIICEPGESVADRYPMACISVAGNCGGREARKGSFGRKFGTRRSAGSLEREESQGSIQFVFG
jgi:hypothetical protein